MALRKLTAADRPILEHATFANVNRMGERFTLADVRAEQKFSHYFEAWPGPTDFGFAEGDAQDQIRGVVWLTRFSANDPGYGFVSREVPELSVWVAESHRGQGVGGSLITAAIREAESRALRAVSLSVEPGNPARRLYERLGFRPAGESFDEGTLLLLVRDHLTDESTP